MKQDINYQLQKGKKENITIDTEYIKRKIRKYYEKLYTHKLYNLDQMDQFLRKHKLQQLTQYEIDLNSHLTLQEIKFVI